MSVHPTSIHPRVLVGQARSTALAREDVLISRVVFGVESAGVLDARGFTLLLRPV
jgi:hypothetical protein